MGCIVHVLRRCICTCICICICMRAFFRETLTCRRETWHTDTVHRALFDGARLGVGWWNVHVQHTCTLGVLCSRDTLSKRRGNCYTDKLHECKLIVNDTRWCGASCTSARANWWCTYAVKQSPMLELPKWYIYDFGPRQCLAMPASSSKS